ncbi:GNAT family N-acetyltransferase [Scopulibacillus cellulosilyticus]|uniref:GNAT family N-acetyltransferase n=1 Tax=Scopulibacillus cellulosilyticus TaxID=2665665 RepID=A0ABW2PWK8_9BACL
MQIRRFKSADLEQILELFYDTVHTVNAKDYHLVQLEAWAPKTPDRSRWMNSLKENISYAAEINGKIIGFGDFNNEAYLDKLFTHKDYQGKGVASKILNTLEQEAMKLGCKEIYTEASITARPFFENKGYTCLNRQNKKHNGQVFINYIMRKTLYTE